MTAGSHMCYTDIVVVVVVVVVVSRGWLCLFLNVID